MKKTRYNRGCRIARECALYAIELHGAKKPSFSLVSSLDASGPPETKGEAILTNHTFSFGFLLDEFSWKEREVVVEVQMECTKTHAIDDGDDTYNGDGYNYKWELTKVVIKDPGLRGISQPSEVEYVVDSFKHIGRGI